MTNDLAEQRIKTVRDHMRLETVWDWDAVIATFEHPRYEMYGAGDGVRRRGSRARLFRGLAHAVPGPGE